jgi:type II secretory pathway component PulF
MRHLADYFGMLAAARGEMLKSLIHPFIVLHLGVFIGTVPTAMVNGGKSMASGAGSFFTTLLVVYVVIWMAYVGFRALLRAARGNASMDRLLDRLPLVGKARCNLAMAGFCRVYHTCLLASIPMRETVRLAAAASRSGMIRAAGVRLEKTVSEGNPLGPRFVAEPAFPKTFARSYSTGEVAGTLDTDLMTWSRRFQNEAEAGAKTLATVIPKLLYLLILVYAGWKIVGFFNGYYGSLLKELE